MDEYWSLTTHHNYLVATSHLSLFSAAYAYRNHNQLWIIPAGVYLNSVNYWRKPTMGWRRNIDILYALHGLVYTSVVAYQLPVFLTWYFLLTFLSIVAYPTSIYFYSRKRYVISTFIHSLIHILANIANIILYKNMLLLLD
jgi:hypothetical protein